VQNLAAGVEKTGDGFIGRRRRCNDKAKSTLKTAVLLWLRGVAQQALKRHVLKPWQTRSATHDDCQQVTP